MQNILLHMVHYSLSTWQKHLMASDRNLIDFSDANTDTKPKQVIPGATPSTLVSASVVPTASVADHSVDINVASSSGPLNTATRPSTNKQKSLFEITRVESNHGDSVGGEDSEMDDSVSSSTSVLDIISKDLETENKETSTVIKTKIVNTDDALQHQQQTAVGLVGVTNPNIVQPQLPLGTSQANFQHQPVPITTSSNTLAAQPSEAQSRFRIVKIAKKKPYERGTWMVNDFNDSQKQAEATETAPSSPVVKRNRNPTSESGGVTSPTEPIKTKSTEFLAQNFSNTQSRGSSYNTAGDRRSSVESTTVSESGSGTPIATPSVTPMVEALEVALDQIQSIRDSMLSSVSDEMKKLRETVDKFQVDNTRLKDENESLRRKLAAAEDKITALEKG